MEKDGAMVWPSAFSTAAVSKAFAPSAFFVVVFLIYKEIFQKSIRYFAEQKGKWYCVDQKILKKIKVKDALGRNSTV